MKKFELYFPVKPKRVNQSFGTNPEYYQKNITDESGKPIIEGHNGIDFYATHGQPVRATHDGVCYVGVDNREGYGVVIRTRESFDYNGREVFFKTIYWHLVNNIPVENGQVVKTGDIIGYADNTGLSTGDHLHFGLKPQAQGEENGSWYNVEQKNGYAGAIDPTPYFTGFFAEDFEKVKEIEKDIGIVARLVAALKETVVSWLFLRK